MTKDERTVMALLLATQDQERTGAAQWASHDGKTLSKDVPVLAVLCHQLAMADDPMLQCVGRFALIGLRDTLMALQERGVALPTLKGAQ